MKTGRLVVFAICLAMLFTACGKNGDGGETTAPTQSETATSGTTEGTEATVSWDIFTNVDDSFPFEQYVKDEKAKWHIGREVNFTWYVNYTGHYATKPWTEYEALKTVAEITGITVTGEIPTIDPTEKMRMMMATNDLPDLITIGFGDPIGHELIAGGHVLCLEDLINQYVPEFNDELPQILREIGTYDDIDGKMWSISGVTNPEWLLKEKKDPGIGNFSYNVRKDLWMDLGEPSIATPDDLYNTLKLFKQTYPTLEGKTSIGIGAYAGGEDVLMTIGYSFGVYNVYYDEETRICTTKYLDPDYPRFIEYLNRLYREGLMDPDMFGKDSQTATEDLSSRVFMLPYVWHALDQGANQILESKDPDSHFIAIPPMDATGEGFKFPGASRVGGAVQTFITKDCVDPEAAVKLIRYGFSPAGSMQVGQGNPGQHYHVENGVFFRPEREAQKMAEDSAAYLNKTGIWCYYMLWYQPMPMRRDYSEDRAKYDVPNSTPYAYDSTIETYMMIPSPTTDEGVARNTVEAIAGARYAAIMAPTAEESAQIIQQMIRDIRNAVDYDKLEKYMTERYQKNLEKFGGPLY